MKRTISTYEMQGEIANALSGFGKNQIYSLYVEAFPDRKIEYIDGDEYEIEDQPTPSEQSEA